MEEAAPSARQKEDVTLTTLIVAIHDAHKGRYGIDRIHADLARTGTGSARSGSAAWPGQRPALRAPAAVQGHHAAGSGERLRPGRPGRPRLRAGGKNQLWYGDITYIFTMSGWAYLTTVIDGYSRKVVGWSVADNMREEMVIDALAWQCGTGIPVSARPSSTRIGEASTLAGRSVTPAFPMASYHRSGKRHLFRQRCRRIMQCDVQEGAHPSARLEEPRACEAGSLRVYRGVLQP